MPPTDPRASPPRPAPDLLGDYHPPAGVADELLRSDGTMRPVWAPLIDHLGGLSGNAVAQGFARGDQYLRDAGVYYRHYDGSDSTPRAWPLSHVPVLIHESEWADLSDGLIQRAELLERVMADLYGPGDLVRNGLLPARIVAQNPEWLRPMVGVRPPSGHHLHVIAFEVGRSPDGSWLVLGDRTQAPSGMGFALENRMATSRVFPDLIADANVHRLSGFFRQFRGALNALRTDGDGRVAILSPGQHTDTYYEHAYIARYLGFLLLECEDLRTVQGRLAVRTINGMEPVSVLWRRLDSRFADPLELDEHSALGTPGLISALRNGAVTMLNTLGSGVLEARALMAFLPRIARTLIGERLKLPNIATWWCGQEDEMRYVRANLERMMIGPAMSTQLPFDLDSSTALGGRFRSAAMQPVAEWLGQNGADLVGQEAVTLSTTPAMIDDRLVPRPMVVRVFAVRTPQGWTVMPGGYARIGRSGDPTALAMRNGGSVADVWVVSDTPVTHDTLSGESDAPFVRRKPGRLPARAADNLFWLGRYVERADFAARALRAHHKRQNDGDTLTTPLADRMAAFLKLHGIDPADPVPPALIDLMDRARGCAGKVRDRFSDDGLHALDDLAASARASAEDPDIDGPEAMSALLRKLAAFAGLATDNMFRTAGWRFMTMGRALERGIQMSALLAEFTGPDAPHGAYDLSIEVGDSVMSHRRRYSVETNRLTVIDMLALDPENPRSIMFQLDLLKAQQALIPRRDSSTQMGALARQITRLHTDLFTATPEDLAQDDIAAIGVKLRAISDQLNLRYLS